MIVGSEPWIRTKSAGRVRHVHFAPGCHGGKPYIAILRGTDRKQISRNAMPTQAFALRGLAYLFRAAFLLSGQANKEVEVLQ